MHFPDFLSAEGQSWWQDQVTNFYSQVEFDGLWVDMNEPSNFCTGHVCELPPAGLMDFVDHSARFPIVFNNVKHLAFKHILAESKGHTDACATKGLIALHFGVQALSPSSRLARSRLHVSCSAGAWSPTSSSGCCRSSPSTTWPAPTAQELS